MNQLGQTAVSADKAPRTERGRKTVRKLLEAAAREFGERGYHEAAITGITQRAGVALGTFYTYFESKEELFRALVRDMSHATRQHVAEAVAGAPDRVAAERLGHAAVIAVTRAPPELYR
ncbi:MAG: TetR/AcrR family transcriptional regulator, partial [Sphingosinicella sp.]|uniref:TetR/AcrR family transcriptional regulator n=1 Tax=Sphingosinicella sp. TaxID=1917971 RepID=UPI004037FB11